MALRTSLGSWSASVSWQAPEGASCPQAVPSGEALRHWGGGSLPSINWGVPGTAELGSSQGQMPHSVVGRWRSSWLRKARGSPAEPLSLEPLSPGPLSTRPAFLEGVSEKPQIGRSRQHSRKGKKKKRSRKRSCGNPLALHQAPRLAEETLLAPTQQDHSLVPSWHLGGRGAATKGKELPLLSQGSGCSRRVGGSGDWNPPPQRKASSALALPGQPEVLSAR